MHTHVRMNVHPPRQLHGQSGVIACVEMNCTRTHQEARDELNKFENMRILAVRFPWEAKKLAQAQQMAAAGTLLHWAGLVLFGELLPKA